MNLLRVLLNALFPPRTSATHVSRTTLAEIGAFVVPTTVPVNEHSVVSLLPFREPLVRSLILEAKYHENQRAHALLGAVLADYLLSLLEDTAFEELHFVLVPVPLSKRRYQERGYNQTECIVREALKFLPDSFSLNTHLVRRVRHTKSQTSLSRQARLTNMHDAFSFTGTLESTCTYVVIDDVITTGATLGAVMQILSGEVVGISLAH